MDISIIGGGSVGLLMASYLGKIHNVTIYTRTRTQADKLNHDGLLLLYESKVQQTDVRAKQVGEWSGADYDLTIVAVKQTQLPDILDRIEKSPGCRVYLFVQNGMGHIKWISKMKADTIFLGSVEHGAYKLNDNTVQQNGFGQIKAAVFMGGTRVLEALSTSLKDAFPIVIEQDYKKMLEKKLIANAVINPLTALLNVPNGKLITNRHYYKLFNSLFSEIVEILEVENKDEELSYVHTICKNTANNRSSMLKDFDNQRPTEVDGILGYLLEEAKEKNKSAPLISHYYHAIKGKELEMEGR